VHETWSFTFREEHRLRVFKNRVLRIFGPERDEVKWEWRRLHNEMFYALHSTNIQVLKSRRLRWAGHVACMRVRRGVYRVLVGKPEGSRPLATPRYRWEDNVKMDLQKVGWSGMVLD
jgi:hypothetical protein